MEKMRQFKRKFKKIGKNLIKSGKFEKNWVSLRKFGEN